MTFRRCFMTRLQCVIVVASLLAASRGGAVASRKIAGHIEDAVTLAPVPGADVVLLDGDKELQRTRTDSDGRFTFSAAGERLHVRVHSAAYREAEEIVPAAERTMQIDMHAGSRISGRVVDGKGAPVKATAACLVQIVREVDAVETGADGRFVLPHCGPSIRVHAPGYAVETVSWGSVVDGDEMTTTVALQNGVSVDGRVVDPDGKPVSGADVLVFFSTINPFLGASASARTGPDGRFKFSDLGTGPRDFLALREHGPVGIEARDLHGPATIEIVLPKPTALAGHVREADGKPAAGARVLAGWFLEDRKASQLNGVRAIVRATHGVSGRQDRDETTADSTGAFRFPDVWMTPTYLRASGLSGRTDAQAKPGEEVVMTLSSGGGAIAGMVVDSNGALVEIEASLSLSAALTHRPAPGEQIRTLSEEGAVQGGRFRVGGIAQGKWDVMAEFESNFTSPMSVDVTAGKTTDIKILIDRNGRVHGRVVDAVTGEPVSNTCVDADWVAPPSKASPFGFRSGVRCSQTNAQGQFRLDKLRGKVTLHLKRGSKERPWPYEPRDAELDVPFGQDVDAGTLKLTRTQRLFPR